MTPILKTPRTAATPSTSPSRAAPETEAARNTAAPQPKEVFTVSGSIDRSRLGQVSGTAADARAFAELQSSSAGRIAGLGELRRPTSDRPIVLTPSQVPVISAPPARGTAAFKAEVDELLALQCARTPEVQETIEKWAEGATVGWNDIARVLVAKNGTPPWAAARIYAALSVAQYDAMVATKAAEKEHPRAAPSRLDHRIEPSIRGPSKSAHPSEHAAIAEASFAILSAMFPKDAELLKANHDEHLMTRLQAGVAFRSDLTAGQSIGAAAARAVLARCAVDGASNPTVPTPPPSAPGVWSSSENPPKIPGGAGFQNVMPWSIPSADFARPTPPAFDSPEFKAALQEVRELSDHRTPEQLAIAMHWSDGPGTATPPGHWNQIATDLIKQRRMTDLDAARTLAFTNMALMDAAVAAWDAKFAHWLIRPSQVDPKITTPPGLPNFPAYVSGHATFSGAAAEVLGHFFPSERNELRAMAEEAAMSRVYGGIHYRFDGDDGIALGKAVAAETLKKLSH